MKKILISLIFVIIIFNSNVIADDLESKIGDYVNFGSYNNKPLTWRIINKDNNGILLFCDKIIEIKSFDTTNNYWPRSNVRTWLNSNKVKVNYYHREENNNFFNFNDYENQAGFLKEFTNKEMDLITPINHKVLLSNNNIETKYGGNEGHIYNDSLKEAIANYKRSYFQIVKDKVFLLSVKEVNELLNNTDIGIYADLSEDIKSKFRGNLKEEFMAYWLRTPTFNSKRGVRCVRLDEIAINNCDFSLNGIRPALYIKNEALYQGEGTKDNPYGIEGLNDKKNYKSFVERIFLLNILAAIYLYIFKRVNVLDIKLDKFKSGIVFILSIITFSLFMYNNNFMLSINFIVLLLIFSKVYGCDWIKVIISLLFVSVILLLGNLYSIKILDLLYNVSPNGYDRTGFLSKVTKNILLLQFSYIFTELIDNTVKKIKKRLDKQSNKGRLMSLFYIIGITLPLILSRYIYNLVIKSTGTYINERFYYVGMFLIIMMVSLLSFSFILMFVHFLYKDKQIYNLSKIAKKDDMTGALNRREGLRVLKEMIKEAKIKNKDLTVCFVDIDNLKYVNDNLGHKEGDSLISNVSDIIINKLRKSDVLCRLGGDEFLLIMDNCNTLKAKKVLNRINLEIDKFNDFEGKNYKTGLSYGFAELKESINIDELIELADKEMYKNKKLNKAIYTKNRN
ncbi:MAG: GGDEF domain-containing protein [Firmicutes bacterium]|nr:GGDEF domain-containing protein [Bacillota bacterium]